MCVAALSRQQTQLKWPSLSLFYMQLYASNTTDCCHINARWRNTAHICCTNLPCKIDPLDPCTAGVQSFSSSCSYQLDRFTHCIIYLYLTAAHSIIERLVDIFIPMLHEYPAILSLSRQPSHQDGLKGASLVVTINCLVHQSWRITA